jgi:hypothetical protein
MSKHRQHKLVLKLLECAAFVFTFATSAAALAEPEPAVDVVIQDEPPRRILTIEWQPVPLITGKAIANIVIAPVDHHALVLSPAYVSTETAAIYIYDDAGNPTQLPKQTFKGFRGELGYRYYFGKGGPRGFFLGPSAVLSPLTATAQDGSKTNFLNYGIAADIGYQALVADRVSLTLGGGAEYTWNNKTIPNQQYPSNLYANGGVHPRLIFSLGCAF